MIEITIHKTLCVSGARDFIKDVVASELTIENPLFIEAEKAGRYTRNISPVIVNFWIDQLGNAHLPRGYKDRLVFLLTHYKLPYEIKDLRMWAASTFDYEPDIMLRPYQFDALQDLAKSSEGVLVSPAASGKTVMGLSLMVMSGQKTLWITHTKPLALQVLERIPRFLKGIKSADITRLSTGTWNVADQIYVGLVQTLKQDVNPLVHLYESYGLVIIDECHHLPAVTFTSVVSKLCPYYLYGLTATPKRRDGLEDLLYQGVGPIRHVVNRDHLKAEGSIITPRIKVVRLETLPLNGNSFAELIAELSQNDKRTNIIVSDVVRESKNGHVCIITTDRKVHAEIIYEKLLKTGVKVGIATGNNKEKERVAAIKALEAGEITTLVCTTQLLGEGFDHAPLDRLFIGLPFRNLAKCEQLVGRVQRPSKGKKDAIIFDYVDITNSLTMHQFKNFGTRGCRFNVYQSLGCVVEE